MRSRSNEQRLLSALPRPGDVPQPALAVAQKLLYTLADAAETYLSADVDMPTFQADQDALEAALAQVRLYARGHEVS